MGTRASTLAHELNQPLAAVALYLGTIRDMLDERDDEPFVSLLSVMDDAAQETLRAGHLVRRLRDFVARGAVHKSLHELPQVLPAATQPALTRGSDRGIRSALAVAPAATRVIVPRACGRAWCRERVCEDED